MMGVNDGVDDQREDGLMGVMWYNPVANCENSGWLMGNESQPSMKANDGAPLLVNAVLLIITMADDGEFLFVQGFSYQPKVITVHDGQKWQMIIVLNSSKQWLRIVNAGK